MAKQEDGAKRACTESLAYVTQTMEISEPIGHLRSLLEPRLQCSLSGHTIQLQGVQLTPSRSLLEQGVRTDGMVHLSVEVNSKAGAERLNIVEIVKTVETLDVIIDPDAHREDTAASEVLAEGAGGGGDGGIGNTRRTREGEGHSEQVARWAAALEGYRRQQELEGIPYEPTEWSSAEVLRWANWVAREFCLTGLDVSGLVGLTGRNLVALSRSAFLVRVPSGEALWSHLQLLSKFVQASREQNGNIATVTIDQPFEIVPALSPVTTKVVPSRGKPRLSRSLDDRCSPGNRTGNNGQIQLWQFLLELLTDRDARDAIAWVGERGEFRLNQPELVAQRWGQRKNKPTMNYEKLSRALRYYYDGDMICKVQGKRFVYRFVCDLKSLIGYSAAELNKLVRESEARRIGTMETALPLTVAIASTPTNPGNTATTHAVSI